MTDPVDRHRDPNTASDGEGPASPPASADALAGAPDKYRQLFRRVPIATWVWDLETLRFVAVNEAATALYGYSRDEFLQLTVVEMRPPAERSRGRGTDEPRQHRRAIASSRR